MGDTACRQTTRVITSGHTGLKTSTTLPKVMELTPSGLVVDPILALQILKSGGVSDFNLKSFITQLAPSLTLALVFHVLTSWLVDSQIPKVICTQSPSAAKLSQR